jgi:hypothetical protein
MLWTLFLILLVLWAVGFIGFHVVATFALNVLPVADPTTFR